MLQNAFALFSLACASFPVVQVFAVEENLQTTVQTLATDSAHHNDKLRLGVDSHDRTDAKAWNVSKERKSRGEMQGLKPNVLNGIESHTPESPDSSSYERFLVRRPATTHLEQDEANRHDLVEIAGIVIGVDGNPLANVPLGIDYITEKTATINARQLKSQTDGRFRVSGLPKNARLFVRYSRWPGRDDPVDPSVNLAIVEISSGSEDRESIKLDMAKSNGSVQGKLLDKDGKGVAKANISITYGPTSTRLDQSISALSDADGNFHVSGLPAGSYVVSAMVDHIRQSDRITVQLASGKTVEVELHDFFQGSPAPRRNVEPSWGKKYDQGLQAGVIADPICKVYERGDRIRARIILRNTGDQIAYATHSEARNRLHLAISPTNEATLQSRIEIFDYSGFTGSVATTDYLIKPGHEVEVGSFTIYLNSSGRSGYSFKGNQFELAVGDDVVVELIASLGDGLNGIGLHQMPDDDGDDSYPATGRYQIKVKGTR